MHYKTLCYTAPKIQDRLRKQPFKICQRHMRMMMIGLDVESALIGLYVVEMCHFTPRFSMISRIADTLFAGYLQFI